MSVKKTKPIGFEAAFIGTLWRPGNSLVITIPDYIVKGLVLKDKDPVEIIIKKIGRID